MKQMGISQQEIDSERVVIEKRDGSKIVIENPCVTKVKMQGQETFQIAGDISEQNAEVGISESDIETIVEKIGCTKEQAQEALEKTGDLAEAILEMS